MEKVDFVHHTPMTVLPMGALAEIDCQNGRFSILESGVNNVIVFGGKIAPSLMNQYSHLKALCVRGV